MSNHEYWDQEPEGQGSGRPEKGGAGVPHSVEAERGVLGCCLLEPEEVMGEVLAVVRGADWFYDGRHGVIFEVLRRMYDGNERIDVITVMQRLRDGGDLERVGGIEGLNGLMDGVPSAAHVGAYLGVVKGKFLLRSLQTTARRILASIESTEEAPEQVVAAAEGMVMAVGEAHVATTEARAGEELAGIEEELDGFVRGRKVMAGLPTGFNYLDNMLCGMAGGDYIVIGARPSVGKTSLVMQIAEYLAIDCKLAVGVFSLEMTRKSLVKRALFSRARADFQKYRNGYLVESDVPKIVQAGREIYGAKLFIDDGSGLTPRLLRIKARRMVRKHGVKLICVDYLQLMSGDARRYDNRNEEVGDISKRMKALAKELDIPIVVLAQLNRDLEKDPNRKPQMSDLRESGNVEQDADVIGILYDVNLKKVEDDLQDPAMRWLHKVPTIPGMAEAVADKPENWRKFVRRLNLLICKQRNGPTGDVGLIYLKPWMRFIDAYEVRADGSEAPEAAEGQRGGGNGRFEMTEEEERAARQPREHGRATTGDLI